MDAPTTLETGGEGGGPSPTIWDDKNHIRGNARKILQLLQLGVFSELEIKTLLRGALPIGLNAIKQKKGREYAAVMRIILECAKIENGIGDKQNGDINILVNGNVQLTQSQRVVRIAALLADGGPIEPSGQPDAGATGGAGPPPGRDQPGEMDSTPRPTNGRPH